VLRRKSSKTIKGIQVSRNELLKAKPIRNPGLEWTQDDKGVHIEIPRKKTLRFRIFFSRLLHLTRGKRILLDEQGSFIWSLCTGENSFKSIAEALSEKYKLPISNAEAALELYFAQLSKQGLVGFVLPESARKRYKRRFANSAEIEKREKTD
jgi:hypothetical protein